MWPVSPTPSLARNQFQFRLFDSSYHQGDADQLYAMFFSFSFVFLDASASLYEALSVGPSVGRSVGNAFVKIDEKSTFTDSK